MKHKSPKYFQNHNKTNFPLKIQNHKIYLIIIKIIFLKKYNYQSILFSNYLNHQKPTYISILHYHLLITKKKITNKLNLPNITF